MLRSMISLVGRPPSSNAEERRQTSSVDSSVVERMAAQRRPAEPLQKLTNSPPVKGTPITKAFVTDKPKKDEADQTALSSKSWSVQPEQLMLLAPGAGGDLDAAQVQVLNHTDRVMSFELSWPGHCLTVTPQHGKVDARSHQVILVSPNPATQGKADIFPWRGNLFIHCDNGQKAVKIQIREDLALEKSTFTSAQLQPLVNQDATPNVTPAAGLHKEKSPTAEVSVASKVLKFPPTRKGETAESCLDFRNGSEKEMKWELTSFAPAYVKGVDDTNDIFRATYTVFRFARISGTLGGTERIQIPVIFIPREVGSYSQFWDLQTELRGMSGDPAHTTRIQLIAQGKESVDSADDSLPRNQQRSRKISGNNLSTTTARTGGSDNAKTGLVVPCDRYVFPVTVVDQSSMEKVLIKNDSATPVSVSNLIVIVFTSLSRQKIVSSVLLWKQRC
ncbi:CEP192 [Branchiostoma lanceolatum]|uniref:CEP192 protein n=1 Tax=Branchiostoma lanceolatum TaxID=7740 RepID=A0A8K0A6N1_BRALA|nr:CEP192 [Branchiostoma lanceolatum]